MNRFLEDAAATEAFGSVLAGCLASGEPWLVTLAGELGAGKTTLVRGLLRGLGHEGRVRSPTFTLVEPYELDGRMILHLDLYRIGDPAELEYLGFREHLAGDNIVMIEWPEKGGTVIPTADLAVRLGYQDQGRRLEVEAGTERGRSALDLLRKAS